MGKMPCVGICQEQVGKLTKNLDDDKIPLFMEKKFTEFWLNLSCNKLVFLTASPKCDKTLAMLAI